MNTNRHLARVLKALSAAQNHLSAKTLATKGSRPRGTFYGDARGEWEYTDGYPLGILGGGDWTWYASIALSSKNQWRNMSVEGATEQHRGFRKALQEIVREYPEVLDFQVVFDGPYMEVADLIGQKTETDLSKVKFYHGTSSLVEDAILEDGLNPRRMTKRGPSYGAEFGAPEGRDDAVYLTTQEGMARAAAFSAARNARLKGLSGEPIIFVIQGLDPRYFVPDEDSRETDPVKSLERLGSIAYTKPIPPRLIKKVIRVS